MTSNKLKPSFSKVRTYRRCPAEYRYMYVEKASMNKEAKENVKKALNGTKKASPRLLGKLVDIALSEGIDKAKKRLYTSVEKNDETETQMMLVEFWVNRIKAMLSDGQFQVDLPDESRIQGSIDYLSSSGDVLLDIKYSGNPFHLYSPDEELQVQLYASELPVKPKYIGFLIVPNVAMVRHKGESLRDYRLRLLEKAAEEGASIHWVEYDQSEVDRFWDDMEKIKNDTEFTATPGDQCSRCQFKGICPNAIVEVK